MIVFVKNQRGVSLSIDVLPSTKVRDLIRRVESDQEVIQVDFGKVRLFRKGEELDRNKTLEELGVDHCTLINIQQDDDDQ